MASALQCQKCREPLRVDGSLEHLNPASFKILAEAAPVLDPKPPDAPRSAAAKDRRQLYDEVSRQAGPPMHKRNVSASQQRSSSGRVNPDSSYILLSESQVGGGTKDNSPSKRLSSTPSPRKSSSLNTADGTTLLSQEMETTMRLFEVLSARSDVDHPICTECTDLLLDGLQRRQAAALRERDAYVSFLKAAQQQDAPSAEEKAATQRALTEAQAREATALAELESLEREKARMEVELAALDAESAALEDEEAAFWRARNAFAAKLTGFREERDSLQAQLAHETTLLEALQRTNVYNDTFCVGHDGTFGTINGLRLGRTPDHPVDWAEINAAWGQTLLLLTVVIEKLGFKLRGYELVPVGSTSKVVKVDYAAATASTTASTAAEPRAKRTIFELYSSGDLPLGLGFLHRNFDNAMVAFLECLRQTGEHVARTTPAAPTTSGGAGAAGGALRMPYTIVKDRIGDVSIKLGSFGQEEQWTKACKYTLTCCKFLLAHASHIQDNAGARAARG